ncbi:DNA-methyltransferase [Pseudomonas luteola]|uniref:DNA-methyltransferase n=1 Tax=Pseudomonas luteola TaxID=47886 RepID=A0A2X2E371_PSELU|nr:MULTISPECIES: DNA adenine methylase [Pseudomonas]SPZ02509.1 DNA-methyltransferase [Pseudomonas luteola]
MSVAPSFVTPLRYPGGKGRLGAWLAKLIEHNGLDGGTYIEPYAGGAGAAVYLLTKNYVENIVINDIDPAIYSFWWSIFNDSDRFLRLLNDTPVNLDIWNVQREIFLKGDSSDKTELGFATFFLNRTNRSGIIKGGVIGGKKQDGKYKLDARFNKKSLSSRIEELALIASRVKLENLDAMDLIAREDTIEGKKLIYLDPPYFKKGSQLYRNHYKPSDHIEISSFVTGLKSPWIVTYDNCEEIHEIYSGKNKQEFSFHYSTHIARPKAQEIMFFGNLSLQSPPTMRR